MLELSARQERALRHAYEMSRSDDEFAIVIGYAGRTVRMLARRHGWARLPASRGDLAVRSRRILEGRLQKIEAGLAAPRLSEAAGKALSAEALKLHAALAAPDRTGAAQVRAEAALSEEALTETLRAIDERIEQRAEQRASERFAGLGAGACDATAGAGGGAELAADGDAATIDAGQSGDLAADRR